MMNPTTKPVIDRLRNANTVADEMKSSRTHTLAVPRLLIS